ncbi:hypothetical protein JCM3766R1_006770 [Sporobolomyces carnicolor]
MPARRSSVASSAAEPRRSSRKSITVLPPPAAPKAKAAAKPAAKAKKVLKKSRRASKIQEESDEDDDESDELTSEDELDSDEETKTATGARKRKAPAAKAKKADAASSDAKPKKAKKEPRAIKPKPRRAAVQGLNPLPTLYEPFPLYSAFTSPTKSFEIEPLPTPDEAPRSIFVFGTGDMGQHGLGTSTLDEIKRPRRHVGVEEKIDNAEAGWERGVGELVCGGMHTLAIDANGKVWSWGINDNAALGRLTSKPDIESEELEANLYPVEGLTGLNEEEFKAIRVAAGDSVSLAVSEQGEVKAWGSFRSAEGLLGFDGSADSSKTQLNPTSLKNLDKHSVVQIACGDDHFLALTSTGFVFACGNGEQNQLGRKIVQRHKTHGLTPERLALKKIVLVGTGSYHSFAVSSEGQVYAWGSNSFHQTGLTSDEEVIQTPTIVESLAPENHDGHRVVQIAGGAHHSLFLFSNGEVWAVGRADGHEVGVADNHPEMKANEERKEEARKERAAREREELDKRIDAATGEVIESSLTVDEETGDKISKADAEFQAKEAAAKGVPLPNDFVLNPTRLEFPKEPKENDASFKADDFDEDTETEETRIVSIASGTRHNFAISARGYVYSWGVGASSQLGQGNEEEIETPKRIWNTALSNVRAVKVETGGQHSVIIGVDREWQEKHEKRQAAKKARDEEEAASKKQKEAADAAEKSKKETNGDDKKDEGEAEKKEGEDKMEVDGAEDKAKEDVVENGVESNANASTEESSA